MIPLCSTSDWGPGACCSTIVLNPVVVVKLTSLAGFAVFNDTVILYNFGMPRLKGYHSSGSPFGTVTFAEISVDVVVSPGMLETATASDVYFNSGNRTTILGLTSFWVDRTTNVTLTIQSAFWSGEIEGFCPTLWISMPRSSMKRVGPTVMEEVRSVALVFGERVTKNAGLWIPAGANAGPWRNGRLTLCLLSWKYSYPIPAKIRCYFTDVSVTIWYLKLDMKWVNKVW